MSWIQQAKRQGQGTWVSRMPSQQLVGARQRSCPLVGLVGSCCSGCAKGKGCAAEEEIQHHVGESAIPWDDVSATNATVEHVQEAAGALASAPSGSPEFQRFQLWSLFYTTWIVWYGAAKAGVDEGVTLGGVKFIHGDMADAYKSLVLSFNQQLKALADLKVAATTAPVDTRSPAGKAFDATVEGVLSGAGGALGIASTTLTYLAIGGAVLLGLYFVGPIIAAKVLKR